MTKVLTFDLGTTYFKVCLFDDREQLLAATQVAVPTIHPGRDQAELPVADFCRTLTSAVEVIRSQAGGLRGVTKVGFASQANTFTLLDEESRPLLPFLLWNDGRAGDQEDSLRAYSARPGVAAATGIPQLDRYFLPVKFRYLRQHEPLAFARATRISTLSEYLVWWLTGRWLTEESLAGLTGLIDIHRLCYWPEALAHFGIPIAWLSEIVRSGTDVGRIRPARSAEFGLAEDCRLAMGCLDQYAGAIGVGNVALGGVSETTGTVLATLRCSEVASANFGLGVFLGPSSSPGMY